MIEIASAISFMVLFLHVCTWEGMIFSFVSSSLKGLPGYLKKPLYDCPICMTPWWGCFIIAIGIYGDLWDFSKFWHVGLTVLTSAGISTVLTYLVNMAKAVTKTLNEYECSCTKKEDKAIERKERLAKIGWL